MKQDETLEQPGTPAGHEGPNPRAEGRAGAEAEDYKVQDRRHWMVDEGADPAAETAETGVRQPSVVEGYRQRAEAAEAKLLEYIAAFKKHEQEQDEFRGRVQADVERKVDLKFGGLVSELLETVDDLNLGLSHVQGVPEAKPLARGVAMARDRFLATLERHGIQEVSLDDAAFDPNEAEAMRVDPVDSPEMDGRVTETLRPGYKLGDRVIRAAQVAVGRHDPNGG